MNNKEILSPANFIFDFYKKFYSVSYHEVLKSKVTRKQISFKERKVSFLCGTEAKIGGCQGLDPFVYTF